MPTIYDYVVAKELATNWNINADLREPYLGEAFFPNKKQLGLDLTWIKGSRKAPVSLSLSAFDAKVIPLNREGFEKLATEMPFFKNSMIVDEKQRQELNKVMHPIIRGQSILFCLKFITMKCTSWKMQV